MTVDIGGVPPPIKCNAKDKYWRYWDNVSACRCFDAQSPAAIEGTLLARMDSTITGHPSFPPINQLVSTCQEHLQTLIDSRTVDSRANSSSQSPLLQQCRDGKHLLAELSSTLREYEEDLSNRYCGENAHVTSMLGVLNRLKDFLIDKTATSNESDDRSCNFIKRSIGILNDRLPLLLEEMWNATKPDTIHTVLCELFPTVRDYLIIRLVDACHKYLEQGGALCFVCTIENCAESSTLYSDREEWFAHEFKCHRQGYRCAGGGTGHHCHQLFSTTDEMICHTESILGEPAIDQKKESWIWRCAPSDSHVCQICFQEVNRQRFIYHTSDHFEEIKKALRQMDWHENSNR